jgi:putative FmdB family regulatory protein
VPIYEYKCTNGHVFDVIQRMVDEALTECQECGAPAERVLHPVAIHFKGSGFHNTDYGKKKTGASGSSEGGKDSGESGDSKEKSSESKPSDSKAAASTASD